MGKKKPKNQKKTREEEKIEIFAADPKYMKKRG
jgi:hypothetical protein